MSARVFKPNQDFTTCGLPDDAQESVICGVALRGNEEDTRSRTFVMLAWPGVGGRCESDSDTRPLGSRGARSVASLPVSASSRLRPCT